MANLAKLKKDAADYEQRRQFDRALAAYRDVLRAQDGSEDLDVALYNRVGDLELRQGHVADALRSYERAADLYIERGFPNNAIALCNKILRHDPTRAEVYARLARVSASKGFRHEARQHFAEYTDRMAAGDRLDDALEALREFTSTLAEADELRLVLADELERHGRTDEAAVELRAMLPRFERDRRRTEAAAVRDRLRALDPTFSAEDEGTTDGGDDDAHAPADARWESSVPRGNRGAHPDLILIDPSETSSARAARSSGAVPAPRRAVEAAPVEGFETTAASGPEDDAQDDASDEGDERAIGSLLELAMDDSTVESIAAPGLVIELAPAVELSPPSGEPVASAERLVAPLELHDDLHAADAEDDASGQTASPIDGLDVFLPAGVGLSDPDPDTDAGPPVLELVREDTVTAPADALAADVLSADALVIPSFADSDALSWPTTEPLTSPTPSDELTIAFPSDIDLGEIVDAAPAASDFELVTDEPASPSAPVRPVRPVAPATPVAPIGAPARGTMPTPLTTRPVPSTPVGTRAVEPAAARSTPAEEYVDLGAMLREEEGPRSTRLVVEERAPSGDEQADFSELLKKFKQGLAENVDVDDYESQYDLGVAYKEMGLIDEAIAQFQRALRGTTQRARAYEALGQCFFDREQYAVAGTVLRRATIEPGLGDQELVGVLYLLARIAESMARPEEALELYQRVLAVDITFGDVAERVGMVEQVPR